MDPSWVCSFLEEKHQCFAKETNNSNMMIFIKSPGWWFWAFFVKERVFHPEIHLRGAKAVYGPAAMKVNCMCSVQLYIIYIYTTYCISTKTPSKKKRPTASSQRKTSTLNTALGGGWIRNVGSLTNEMGRGNALAQQTLCDYNRGHYTTNPNNALL